MRNHTILRLLGLFFASTILFFLVLTTPPTTFAAETQPPQFNRFTENLPKLLETDAATVMVRAFTYQVANTLCARLGGAPAQEVEKEATEWRERNDDFIKASAQAIDEIGNQLIPIGGEQEKQSYLQMIMRESTKVANQRIMSQFNGANLDNKVIPPETVCVQFANLLRNGKGDFQSTPEITRALIPYMQRKKTAPLNAGPLHDAVAANNRRDFKTELKILTPLAESGNPDALGNIGNMYAFGNGVDKNLATAYSYWSRAAEKHLGTAMFNIASLYNTGQGGLDKDQSQAALWYKKAAEHRHEKAMINLSSIYATGQGLEKNIRLAAAWASLAATNTKSEQSKNIYLNQLRQLANGMSKEEMDETQKIMSELAQIIDANVDKYMKQRSNGTAQKRAAP